MPTMAAARSMHGRTTQDDLFLDALEAIVIGALVRIGDDPPARFAFFKRLLACAEGRQGIAVIDRCGLCDSPIGRHGRAHLNLSGCAVHPARCMAVARPSRRYGQERVSRLRPLSESPDAPPPW